MKSALQISTRYETQESKNSPKEKMSRGIIFSKYGHHHAILMPAQSTGFHLPELFKNGKEINTSQITSQITSPTTRSSRCFRLAVLAQGLRLKSWFHNDSSFQILKIRERTLDAFNSSIGSRSSAVSFQKAHSFTLSSLVFSFIILNSACTTTTAKFVDTNRGEFALVSTDEVQSLHGKGLKEGAADKTIATIQKNISDNAKDQSSENSPGNSKRNQKSKSPMDASLELAKLQLAKGDLDSAEKSVKGSLERNLKGQEAKLVLAQIYYRKGRLEMAEMLLSSAEMSGTNASEMNNIKALIAIRRGKPMEAWRLFEDALKLDNTNVAARLNFGMILLEHDLTQKAAIQFERILKLVPKQPDALLMMAMIEARRGNTLTAEKTLESLLGEYKKNPTFLYNYGSVLFQLGKNDAAIETLRKYLANNRIKISHSEDAIALIQTAQDRIAEDDLLKKNISNAVQTSKALTDSQKSTTSLAKKSVNSGADSLNEPKNETANQPTNEPTNEPTKGYQSDLPINEPQGQAAKSSKVNHKANHQKSSLGRQATANLVSQSNKEKKQKITQENTQPDLPQNSESELNEIDQVIEK